MVEVSANADRCELYRKRKEAVERLVHTINSHTIDTHATDEVDTADIGNTTDIDSLWNAIILFQNYPFKTATGLPFSYIIKIGRNGEYTRELWIDRWGESKSLTMSTVVRAYKKAVELRGEEVSRPKALGDLRGVSYTYSIFYRFGLIEVPEKVREKMME